MYGEYIEDISPKYWDHFEVILQMFNKADYGVIVSKRDIIEKCLEHELRFPVKSRDSIIQKILKVIRKMSFLPYFPVANNYGFYKVYNRENGLTWRQSMIERIASMQSQVKAFDERYPDQKTETQESSIKIQYV